KDENPVVHVFDAETGKETRHFPLSRAEVQGGARPRIIAGQGLRTLATKVYNQPVIFYDVATGKETRRLDSETAKSLLPSEDRLRLSPGGKLFAGCDVSSVYHVFDVATGKELHHLDDLAETGGGRCPLLFSPDGKILTCGLHNDSIYLWDLT